MASDPKDAAKKFNNPLFPLRQRHSVFDQLSYPKQSHHEEPPINPNRTQTDIGTIINSVWKPAPPAPPKKTSPDTSIDSSTPKSKKSI